MLDRVGSLHSFIGLIICFHFVRLQIDYSKCQNSSAKERTVLFLCLRAKFGGYNNPSYSPSLLSHHRERRSALLYVLALLYHEIISTNSTCKFSPLSQ